MKKITALLCLSTPLLLLGCAQPKAPSELKAPVFAKQPRDKVLSVCDKNKAPYLERADLFDEPVINVNIERKFQRVIRMNCDGSVATNQIETVRSPRADVILRPSKRLQRDASIVKLLGSETCDNKQSKLPMSDPFIFGQLSAITGDEDGSIKVKMDMAEALFTYKVTTGLNHIYYSYYDGCESENAREACGPRNEIRSGVYNVNVTYSEQTLPGQKTVPAYDCQKNK